MSASPLTPDDPRALGEFQLTGRLGEGGQGIVYLGLSPDGDPVAVKLIKGGLDPAVRSRLTRELDAMRSVASFCTARVLTAAIEGRQPYVVSEFIDGPSLQQRVAASGPFRGGELERLAVGTATALAAIHGAGIVHRDLKPANVLIGPDGPRVVDFGIARQGESETMTAGPVGTPAYLAPEQIAGQPASAASDVFAWGATIVYAATGRPAFGSASVASVLHRIMTTTPDVSEVPEPLRAAVERCLSKDPGHRPTSRDLLLGLVGSAPDPLRGDPSPAWKAEHHGARPGGTGPIPSASATPEPFHGGPLATGPAFRENGRLTTNPSGGRHRRTGLLVGAGGAVAALAVSGTLLWPQITAVVGLGTATSTATSSTSATPSAAETARETAQPSAPASAQPTKEPTPSGQPSGLAIPATFAGTWRGHIVPTPAGFTGEYDIRIELESGESTGKWFEPANSCEGTLMLTTATRTVVTFSLVNAGQCVPGTVALTRKGSALTYQWNDGAGLLAYNGDLTKAG